MEEAETEKAEVEVDVEAKAGAEADPNNEGNVNNGGGVVGAEAKTTTLAVSSPTTTFGPDPPTRRQAHDALGLDMDSDAAAILAATLPSILPPMPPQAVTRVGEETCVWVNAFFGRMYRDAARSSHFHEWFRLQLQKALNKGKVRIRAREHDT